MAAYIYLIGIIIIVISVIYWYIKMMIGAFEYIMDNIVDDTEDE